MVLMVYCHKLTNQISCLSMKNKFWSNQEVNFSNLLFANSVMLLQKKKKNTQMIDL